MSKFIRKSTIYFFTFIVFGLLFVGCSNKIEDNGNEKASEGVIKNIPHPIKQLEDCLSCHKDGLNGAPKTGHPERNNCTSCHKER